MTLSFTQHTLEKLELLLKSLSYKVRYEKGTFKTGACKFESSNIIVVNKYSNLENKIIALAEIIQNLDTDDSLLDEKQKAFFYILKQTKLKF
jgi:hypothetical protein